MLHVQYAMCIVHGSQLNRIPTDNSTKTKNILYNYCSTGYQTLHINCLNVNKAHIFGIKKKTKETKIIIRIMLSSIVGDVGYNLFFRTIYGLWCHNN